MKFSKQVEPIHVPGNVKGEEMTLRKGKEPGRGESRSYRSSRDATSINPENKRPILPTMPSLPPA